MHWCTTWRTRSSGIFHPWIWGGLLPNRVSEENYFGDFFGIANTEVLIIGMVFLLVAIIIRTYGEGPSWIRWYMPDRL